LLLHAVGLLCALAAAVFATAARDRYGALTLAAGFLIGSAWLQPDPGWTGAIVAATAGLALVRPGGAPASRVAPLVAGLAGGLWSRVLGGYGLSKAHPVERVMRDVKALEIFDGTNQIQKMLIGRHLQREGMPF